MAPLTQDQSQVLTRAGAATTAVQRFSQALHALQLAEQPTRESFATDLLKTGSVYRAGGELLFFWPPKPQRDAEQAEAADLVKAISRQVRKTFAGMYVEMIYRQLTREYSRHFRAEELIYEVAGLCPGLCPTRREVAGELEVPLAEKEGCEMAQGDFFSCLLGHPRAGTHLIIAMLQPVPQARHLLEKFRRDGRLDLGAVVVERRGALGCVFFNNLDYLNAEDDSTLLLFETAVDLVLLDPDIQVGLLRGNPVQHPKYRGRRVFSAGLNLTHLYQGKLSLMFYVTRDLGVVNKLYRGLNLASDEPETTLEKSWIAILEAFAIGGGCQLLLVADYVIAEQGAYFNLPARKEGIIPGAAPLRLARFVGQRAAQAGVLFDRTFPVDSPEGRLLVNEVVEPAAMDAAIDRMAREATQSGVVSTGANRKALRLAHEPLDLFRQYMSLFCREQADCHFSPTLVSNLERHWVNRDRRYPQEAKS
jgi:thioesterase DpgC